MKWNTAHAISAVFALALAAALAGQAHAACGSGQRMSHQDAECLRTATRTVENGKTVEVQNLCPSFGDVVAWIDREIETDLTLYLTGENTVKRSVIEVNGVYCCKDLSDLCNTSDIVNDESCFDQFQASAANDSCKDETATANDDIKCKISAYCKDSGGTYLRVPSTITVHWPTVPNLKNCGGNLCGSESVD